MRHPNDILFYAQIINNKMEYKTVNIWIYVISFMCLFTTSCVEDVDKGYKRDGNEQFRLFTKTCADKSKCGNSSVRTNCNCDILCRLFNDCCSNNRDVNNRTSDNDETKARYANLNREQFKCQSFYSQDGLTSELMVSLCTKTWLDKTTQQLCENVYAGNILLTIPVISIDSDILFRNMYCAYCNNVFEFRYLTFETLLLNNDTESLRINLKYGPMPFSGIRRCKNNWGGMISTCTESGNFTTDQSHLQHLCQSKSILVVFDEHKNTYKNKFCAMCNGIKEHDLLCDYVKKDYIKTYTKHAYSYRMLVDLNLRHTVSNFQDQDEVYSNFKKCNNTHNEIYDPVSNTCRKIYCPPMSKASNGKCKPFNNKIRDQTNMAMRCTFIKLDSHEYIILNSTSIKLLRSNRTINTPNFIVNNSDIYICHKVPALHGHFINIVESYLSVAGLICSILALLVTFSVYMMISELRNLPGKNLMSLMISLLLAQLLFLFSNHASTNAMACKIIAIFVHYFFLSSFTWMNIITFDLFITFSQFRVSFSENSRLFYKYSVHGWLLPSLIVISAIILDYSKISDSKYKPRYGETVCWISSEKALLLFLIGPLAAFKLFDITGFVCTSLYISKSRRQSAIARRHTFSSFLIYLKLSAIMGLTWILAFVALLSKSTAVWYLFIIFNTLQGVFIGLSFLTSKRTLTLVKARIRRGHDTHLASLELVPTQNTSC